MKTLEEIKEEYAKELGWNGWGDLLLNAGGTRQILDRDYNEAAKRYAKEVAREALKNASENAGTKQEYCSDGWTPSVRVVDKRSILDESNIPEL